MSQSSNPPTTTTFLLLKASGPTPAISNTSDPAGDAFNRTLRKIADLPPFHSQLFGWRDTAVASHLVPAAGIDVQREGELIWDAQYFGWRKPGESVQRGAEAAVGSDALVWVINWESDSTLQAKVMDLLNEMAPYFDLPEFAEDSKEKASSSQIFAVKWDEGGPKRILNRTIRPVELTVLSEGLTSFIPESCSGSADLDDEDVATGVLLQQNLLEHQPVLRVHLRSVAPESIDTSAISPNDGQRKVLFRTSLTRTRWCTKIREDMIASIASRRID